MMLPPLWKPLSPIPTGRPYVLLNAAMSADGKICTAGGDTHFSDEADWQEVHAIRASVDAIMVGVNTVLKDDPSLRVKFHPTFKPLARIIVDSAGRTPLSARVFLPGPNLAPTIICATSRIQAGSEKSLKDQGAQVAVINEGDEVDVSKMLTYLYGLGITTLLVEGGGQLNWSLLAAQVVDEIRLFLAPVFVGGQDAISLIRGPGFQKVGDAPSYQLRQVESRGNYITLHYGR